MTTLSVYQYVSFGSWHRREQDSIYLFAIPTFEPMSEKELVEMTKIILVRFGSLRTMIEDIARTYKATLTADGMNSLIADEKIKDIVHRKILCKLDHYL